MVWVTLVRLNSNENPESAHESHRNMILSTGKIMQCFLKSGIAVGANLQKYKRVGLLPPVPRPGSFLPHRQGTNFPLLPFLPCRFLRLLACLLTGPSISFLAWGFLLRRSFSSSPSRGGVGSNSSHPPSLAYHEVACPLCSSLHLIIPHSVPRCCASFAPVRFVALIVPLCFACTAQIAC
jgi:hypothetical protein